MTARRRNSALVTRRKIRFRSETLAWAIFAQQAPILCGKGDVAVDAKQNPVSKFMGPGHGSGCEGLLLMKVFGWWILPVRRAYVVWEGRCGGGIEIVEENKN